MARNVKVPIVALFQQVSDAGDHLSSVIKSDITTIYNDRSLLKLHWAKVKTTYEKYAELSQKLAASLTDKGCIDEALNVRKK